MEQILQTKLKFNSKIYRSFTQLPFMKKIILSLYFAFLLTAVFAQDQKGILISYTLDFKPSKTKAYRSKAISSLYIAENKSIYMDEKTPKIWNLEHLSGTEKAGARLQIGLPTFSYLVLTEGEKTMEIEEQLGGSYVGYAEESISPGSWKIHEDTLSVAGMLTYKATCTLKNRNWTAWFSPEVPLSEGPYKFRGLPGLILQLSSDDADFHFKIRSIEKDIPLPALPMYTLTSKERFFEIRKLSQNSVRKMESQGGTLGEVKFNGKSYTRDEWVRHLDKEYEDKNRIE
jgi:GLPGLI family protein